MPFWVSARHGRGGFLLFLCVCVSSLCLPVCMLCLHHILQCFVILCLFGVLCLFLFVLVRALHKSSGFQQVPSIFACLPGPWCREESWAALAEIPGDGAGAQKATWGWEQVAWHERMLYSQGKAGPPCHMYRSYRNLECVENSLPQMKCDEASAFSSRLHSRSKSTKATQNRCRLEADSLTLGFCTECHSVSLHSALELVHILDASPMQLMVDLKLKRVFYCLVYCTYVYI